MGDPAAALLEVLDPQQNNEFLDHYIGVPFDLSRIMFIGTANSADTIPPSLLDRLEVINLPGYSTDEKVQIALRHLIPKQLEQSGLSRDVLAIGPDTIELLTERYTRESGVRNLERQIASICRKVAVELAAGRQQRPAVGPGEVPQMLGPPPYQARGLEVASRPGLCATVAMGEIGADILYVEVSRASGSGKFLVTGRVGQILKESSQLVYSFLRSSAQKFGMSPGDLETYDYHVHFPGGAVPKEGTFAGLAIFMAFLSLLADTPLPEGTAAVGEFTLQGLLLEDANLPEKLIAARRAGITKVVVPARNRKDIEVSGRSKVPAGLDVIYCATAQEAVKELLPGLLERVHAEGC
jgi:ATP-dependent Lon protease